MAEASAKKVLEDPNVGLNLKQLDQNKKEEIKIPPLTVAEPVSTAVAPEVPPEIDVEELQEESFRRPSVKSTTQWLDAFGILRDDKWDNFPTMLEDREYIDSVEAKLKDFFVPSEDYEKTDIKTKWFAAQHGVAPNKDELTEIFTNYEKLKSLADKVDAKSYMELKTKLDELKNESEALPVINIINQLSSEISDEKREEELRFEMEGFVESNREEIMGGGDLDDPISGEVLSKGI